LAVPSHFLMLWLPLRVVIAGGQLAEEGDPQHGRQQKVSE
jgi:hypothetical protein